jgi:hypothetical protein
MSVEPRGNQWRVRWRDEQGHNRSRTFNRQGAAHKFDEHVRELKALGRLDRLDERPRGLQTVQEWAAHWWETYAEPKLADATLDLYTLQLTLRIIPRWGSTQLRDLDAAADRTVGRPARTGRGGELDDPEHARGHVRHVAPGGTGRRDRPEPDPAGRETTFGAATRPGPHHPVAGGADAGMAARAPPRRRGVTGRDPRVPVGVCGAASGVGGDRPPMGGCRGPDDPVRRHQTRPRHPEATRHEAAGPVGAGSPGMADGVRPAPRDLDPVPRGRSRATCGIRGVAAPSNPPPGCGATGRRTATGSAVELREPPRV